MPNRRVDAALAGRSLGFKEAWAHSVCHDYLDIEYRHGGHSLCINIFLPGYKHNLLFSIHQCWHSYYGSMVLGCYLLDEALGQGIFVPMSTSKWKNAHTHYEGCTLSPTHARYHTHPSTPTLHPASPTLVLTHPTPYVTPP